MPKTGHEINLFYLCRARISLKIRYPSIHNFFKVHIPPELSSWSGPKQVLNKRVTRIQRAFKLIKVLWKTGFKRKIQWTKWHSLIGTPRLIEASHWNTDPLLLKQTWVFFNYLENGFWNIWEFGRHEIHHPWPSQEAKGIISASDPKSAMKSKLWNSWYQATWEHFSWFYMQLSPPFLYPVRGTEVCKMQGCKGHHVFECIETLLWSTSIAMKTEPSAIHEKVVTDSLHTSITTFSPHKLFYQFFSNGNALSSQVCSI